MSTWQMIEAVAASGTEAEASSRDAAMRSLSPGSSVPPVVLYGDEDAKGKGKGRGNPDECPVCRRTPRQFEAQTGLPRASWIEAFCPHCYERLSDELEGVGPARPVPQADATVGPGGRPSAPPAPSVPTADVTLALTRTILADTGIATSPRSGPGEWAPSPSMQSADVPSTEPCSEPEPAGGAAGAELAAAQPAEDYAWLWR